MNKCEICKQEILRDSQFINGKWFHNNCIENQLKKMNELNNIIDELKKDLEDGRSEDNNWLMGYYDASKDFLDKLNKLKGNVTIKIIDLMNKAVNEEEMPKRIKFRKKIYKYDKYVKDYADYSAGYENRVYLFTEVFKENRDTVKILNDEVEIIEEEKKIPEKLNLDKDELRNVESPRIIDYFIESKINEIIDYLKSKGDK